MKRYRLPSVLLAMLVLLGSCSFPEQPYWLVQPWLCSINADGTGFRKIKKAPFNTPGLTDIYMTKDDRIIFYGQKLWISDTDTIKIEQITPDNLVLFDKPQLAFTRGGETAYFAASRDLYVLNLHTNALAKIIESPADYYRAEPLLSDDERYLTYNIYSVKGKEPAKIIAYIDLLDNSMQFVYTTATSFPPSRISKIVTRMGVALFENRDGLGSVSLEDSTYTLLQNYPATSKNMFETTDNQRYLVTKYTQYSPSYKNSAIAIDLLSKTRYDLGTVDASYYSYSNPCKIAQQTNVVYYFDRTNIYKYNLDSHEKSIVFGPNGSIEVVRMIMLAPTWDGSKVYFYAEISER